MKFGDLMEGIIEKAIELQLTPPYLAIWLRIAIYWKNNGYKPVSLTREQLSKQLSISPRTAQRAIQKLETIGAIEVERVLKLPSKYRVSSQLFKGDIKGDKCDKSRETRRETNQGRQSNDPPSLASIANTNKTRLNNTSASHVTSSSSVTCSEPPKIGKTKKLSMWVLKGKKEACEAELKNLRSAGWEDAMSFHYANKADRLRGKELKQMINNLNRKMIDADC